MKFNGRISITRRLTLLFVFASSTVLLTLGLVIASSLQGHFEQQDIAILTKQMELVRTGLHELTSFDDFRHFAHLPAVTAGGQHGPEIIIFGPDHKLLFAISDAGFPFDQVYANAKLTPQIPTLWATNEKTYRVIAAEFPTRVPDRYGEPSNVFVAVAVDIMHHRQFMSSFQHTLWLFVVGAATFTGLLGWVAVRSGLAPLRTMRQQAQKVTAQQLNHRLPVESTPTELAELTKTLNEMLVRLEEGFRRLTEFSSDIAHELRTPVSNLMTQTQVALSRTREAAEYRMTLESNVEEFERMTRMISDMLMLAKSGNGLMVPKPEIIDLGSEFRDLFDYFDAVAEEKGLHLVVEGGGMVSADKVMLRRALANLLSNGVRHAFANTPLRASVSASADIVSITIENTGDVIPPQYMERVFDRFFRIDPSGQRNREGTGLGLAITKSIVVAHGGTISAASHAGVTRFTIRLPRVA